ncbi:MAG: hypothetical protein WD004_06140 [Actinomycetota bacterium]
MKVLLVSWDPKTREMMRLAVGNGERRGAAALEFLEERNGERGVTTAWRELPDVVVADEITSRMGAFGLARDLRGADRPFPGIIAILLDRKQDTWLAEWSGADAWFVKPVDPFELAARIVELLDVKETA